MRHLKATLLSFLIAALFSAQFIDAQVGINTGKSNFIKLNSNYQRSIPPMFEPSSPTIEKTTDFGSQKRNFASPSVLELSYQKLLGLDVHVTKNESSEIVGNNLRLPVRSTDTGSYETRNMPFFESLRLNNRPLMQYGYDIFNRDPVAIGENQEFGPDYKISPGDIFLVATYGTSDIGVEARVDPKHQLFFPKIGTINLKGATYESAESKIISVFRKYYKGSGVYVQIKSRAKRSIMVIGKVKRPGLNLIPPQTSLLDAIFAAGGVEKLGSLRKIQIKSKSKIQHRDLYDLYNGKWEPLVLTGGEIIFVPALKSTTAIIGEVINSGIYEIDNNTTVSKMIELAGGLTPTGMRQIVNIYRPSTNGRTINAITIKQQNISKFKLRNHDIILISKRKTRAGRSYLIKGAVHHPGLFQVNPNLSIHQAITIAGGLLPVHANSVILTRYFNEGKPVKIKNSEKGFVYRRAIEFELDSEDLKHFKVKDHDEIFIPFKRSTSQHIHISILGAVQKPGVYEYIENMSINHLITLAGGIAGSANAKRTIVSRQHQDGKIEQIQVDLTNYAKNDSQRFFLKPGDSVSVPSLSESYIWVKASGEFIRPGTYRLEKGKRLSDLIKVAGGLKATAYSNGAVFNRKSVADVYEKQMRELANALEKNLLRSLITSDESSLSNEQRSRSSSIYTRQLRLIENIRSSTSPGRIAIMLPEDLGDLIDSYDNMALEQGDFLHIPSEPGTVHILGQVNNPNTVAYIEDSNLSTYIDSAGGYTKYADKKNIFVIRANGQVVPAKNFIRVKSWLTNRENETYHEIIEPGDTILVPEDFEIKPNKLTLTKDITQIMFQIITSIGVAAAAF